MSDILTTCLWKSVWRSKMHQARRSQHRTSSNLEPRTESILAYMLLKELIDLTSILYSDVKGVIFGLNYIPEQYSWKDGKTVHYSCYKTFSKYFF